LGWRLLLVLLLGFPNSLLLLGLCEADGIVLEFLERIVG
jgi:hypothetical protein